VRGELQTRAFTLYGFCDSLYLSVNRLTEIVSVDGTREPQLKVVKSRRSWEIFCGHCKSKIAHVHRWIIDKYCEEFCVHCGQYLDYVPVEKMLLDARIMAIARRTGKTNLDSKTGVRQTKTAMEIRQNSKRTQRKPTSTGRSS